MNKITRIALAFTAVLLSGSSFGQFSNVWIAQYQHTVTPGFSNEGRKIALDPSGNIFVLSDMTSDFDLSGNQGAITWHYVTIAKYDPNGVPLEKKPIDVQGHMTSGNHNYAAFGLLTDASGNVYVGHSFYSPISGFDISISKYDNDLVRIWQSTYSTNATDAGVDMKLHPSGNVYAIVRSSDITTTYTLIESGQASASASVVYSFVPDIVGINSLALDGAQMAYVCGYSVKGGFQNAYVGKIDVSTSSLVWGGVYSPPSIVGDDVANKVVVGVDGNIYTVGTIDEGGHNLKVVVLKNLPGNSKFEFVVILGDPSSDDLGLQIDASQSGWVTIASISNGMIPTIYRIPDDGVFTSPGITRLNVEPSSTYNSITGMTISDMKVSTTSSIYVTGSMAATGPSGAFTSAYMEKVSVVFGNALIPAGGTTVDGDFDRNFEGVGISLDYSKVDVYWLRNYWDDVHSTEIVELIDVNIPAPLRQAMSDGTGLISLTPNPSNGKVTVQADAVISRVEVVDLTGKQIFDLSPNSQKVQLITSALAPGIYLCKIRTENGETIEKLAVN